MMAKKQNKANKANKRARLQQEKRSKQIKTYTILGAAVLGLALAGVILFFALGESGPAPLTLAEIRHDPFSFTEEIELMGTVTSHSHLAFALTDTDAAFTLGVDFRGQPPLPAMGETVIATGYIVQDCCSPDAMLQAFAFRPAP